ncbi:MAG: tRNA (guanine-N(1)-)-methyltransferase [Candidatus Nomurabacteria bacterium GW2011_GWF2_43_8]|uniref:tRNA (guanine-N(1)-)-methyltransferase n=3 Tax=Candidatus Nomuraibacteriota TaxID=1752729 RepID=A0A0G1HQA4_9BACT|nr:MAG: tRNA (guanine-N(1)-)-methyltransferase [Candidatus Nomurabacteria bacterium GW2011_GWA2_43_15]KKT18924.1 MAG: tRNA (guanine-N(1)-)-methyltransferase [Candidatus Nomurabacteria bacterium GW2011_GWB1_43_7]KKT21782.1 MAG: tRNA (guanine-N(1)-)-methyltransferase [Candidatus Nomurabacteria bacterium GW2011_GWF2_43_8]
MRFHIITIFPGIFDSYLKESIIGRAIKNKIISVNFYNPRDYVKGNKSNYKPVDGRPYGGGAGMVLQAEPILKSFSKIEGKIKNKKRKVVLFSAKGKFFNQKMAYKWAHKYEEIVFISGRYEGIDERVRQALKAEEISIGPYVLTDGDVAAMVVSSAVIRLMPGVIRLESLEEESHWNLLLKKEKDSKVGESGLEYPHYTRPEILKYKGKKYRVPKVLLSGHRAKIEEWRKGQNKK